MSSEIRNLLANTADIHKTLTGNWESFNITLAKDIDFGADYSLSFECESTAHSVVQARFNYISTDGEYKSLSATPNSPVNTGENHVTLLIPAFNRPDDFARASLMIQATAIANDGAQLTISMPMLVEGTEPAAWAPAEGESLVGGGALMSANLWSDSTASMQIRADGTYLAGKAGTAELTSNVTGLSSLAENQTVHMGASLKNAGAGVLKPFVEYKDAAGNLNWVGFPSWQPTDSWQRFEDTCVVPSGMTVCVVGFDSSEATGDIEVSNPVFNYGSTGIVMAAGSVTVASINDVASTTRWYLLQSSTLTAPDRPTASPPGGSWATTEPTYTEGSTNSLYTCDQTIFSDGTWAYSSVSLSTSYEAAKAAYNKAAAAAAAAAATDQHFWADTDGAHVSSTGDHDTSGFHQLMSSVKNAFMHGSTELMTISANLIKMLSGAFELSVESGTSSDTGETEDIAHLKSQYLSLDGKGTAHGFSGLCASSSTGGLESAKALVDAEAAGTSHADSTVLSNVQVNIGTGDTVLDAEMGVYGSGQTLKQFDGSATSFHTAALIAADAVQVGSAGDLVPLSRLATAIQPVVSRDSGVISDYGSFEAHYTKIGTWSGTSGASTLRLRVMTGRGYNGRANQNSCIDIIVKDASQSSNSTTKAFGVSYELHNAISAVLAPYVVATASDSCDIWIKNSWGWESGWYIAEYGGPSGAGTWSDGGSVHQTSVPSGTLQSASCLGSAVYTGSKILTTTTPDFNFLSNSEYTAITGHAPNKDFDTITVCSGDDSAYRGIMTASIQTSGNIVIRCDPAPGGTIRINYTITTS